MRFFFSHALSMFYLVGFGELCRFYTLDRKKGESKCTKEIRLVESRKTKGIERE